MRFVLFSLAYETKRCSDERVWKNNNPVLHIENVSEEKKNDKEII